MKYLMQFGIIIGLSLVGEVLNSVIPLPVPASVWGMVLLFVHTDRDGINLGASFQPVQTLRC